MSAGRAFVALALVLSCRWHAHTNTQTSSGTREMSARRRKQRQRQRNGERLTRTAHAFPFQDSLNPSKTLSLFSFSVSLLISRSFLSSSPPLHHAFQQMTAVCAVCSPLTGIHSLQHACLLFLPKIRSHNPRSARERGDRESGLWSLSVSLAGKSWRGKLPSCVP